MPTDRTLYLSPLGDPLAVGLPAFITIPANEAFAQFQFLVDNEGAVQFSVAQSPTGIPVGWSTVVDVGDAEGVPPSLWELGLTLEGLGHGGLNQLPYDMLGSEPIATSITPSTAMEIVPVWDGLLPPAEGGGEEVKTYKASCEQWGSYTYWTYYRCVEGRVYGRNAADYCGECHRSPLTELQKPDCPNLLYFWWPAYCKKYSGNFHELSEESCPSPLTNCTVPAGTTTINANVYDWTGSRGEHDCASAELSFGEGIGVAVGVEFNKSCCTYKKNGTKSEEDVPSCEESVSPQ